MYKMCAFLVLFIISCGSHADKETKHDTNPELISDTASIAVPAKNISSDTIPFNFNIGSIKRKHVPVVLQKGLSFDLEIPDGFELFVAAENLGRLRFLAMSPDGRLFATDMKDRSDNKNGRVLVFDGWNENTKKFDSVKVFLTSLHNPNQIEFYKGYIYIAETGRLIRYKYTNGSNGTQGLPELIANFPDYGLSYKYGGWHLTRSIAFNNDKLYVSVGSSCNACLEKEEIRAVVMEMDPDGNNAIIYARGLRNSVGIGFIKGQLWGTGMGRDLIGPDKPEDVFQRIEKYSYHGWPFYYQYQQKVYADEQFKDSARDNFVKEPPLAFLGLKAHSAPLGFEYMKNFNDKELNNSVLICLHGSTSVWRQRGNSIVKAGKGNRYEDIVSGFLQGKTEKERYGRPCDILMKDANSFFFTDDHNGVLYFIRKS